MAWGLAEFDAERRGYKEGVEEGISQGISHRVLNKQKSKLLRIYFQCHFL